MPDSIWTTPGGASLPYTQLIQPAYQETAAEDQRSATVHYDLTSATWSRLNQYYEYLLGTSTISGQFINRSLPHQHPYWPGLYAKNLFLVDTPSKPRRSATDTFNEWDKVRVRVDYVAPQYNLLENDAGQTSELYRFVERHSLLVSEGITIPGAGFVAANFTTLPIRELPAKMLGVRELVYVWHQVPADPTAPSGIWRLPQALETAIDTAIGRVNHAAFDNGRYPANTLLFTGCDQEETWDGVGNRTFKLSYRFLYRLNKNNAGTEVLGHLGIYLAPPNQEPDFYLVKGKPPYDTKRIYEVVDMNSLFLVG
jgi:hypothetical protein